MKKYIVAIATSAEDEEGEQKLVFQRAIVCDRTDIIAALNRLCASLGRLDFGQGDLLRVDDLDQQWVAQLKEMIATDTIPRMGFLSREKDLVKYGMSAAFIIGEENRVRNIRNSDFIICKFLEL